MGTVNRTNDRVLMGDLDSTEQTGRLAGDQWLARLENKEDDDLRDALGLLRFEALLSKRLVMTDAQALDGRVFLGLAISGLLRDLCPDPNAPVLEIRARAKGVRGSALAMFDAQKGGAFRSSFLSDGQSVQKQSPGIDRQGHDLSGIGDYLRRAGADGAEVDALTDGLRAVQTAAKQGHVTLQPWDKDRKWSEMVTLAQRSFPLEQLGALLDASPEGVEEMKRLSVLPLRSDFVRELEEGDWTQDDRDAVTNWFHENYRRAAAFQHQADYRATQSGAIGRVYMRNLTSESMERRTTFIELPDWFIPQLGRLPALEWRTFYGNHQTSLREWWEFGETGSLDRALTALCPALDPAGSTGRRLPRSVVTLGLTLPGNIAALPLALNAHGIATTLAIALGEIAVAGLAQSLGQATTIAVTDYLDDVEPGPPART